MKYVIEKEKRPIYLQLYNTIRNDIVGGNYLYGEKLPSKRELSLKTGVSTVTVEHAYALLCDEGMPNQEKEADLSLPSEEATDSRSAQKTRPHSI